MLETRHRRASVAQAEAQRCPPSDFIKPRGWGVFTSPSWPTSAPVGAPVAAQPANWCWGMRCWKQPVLTLTGFDFLLISPLSLFCAQSVHTHVKSSLCSPPSHTPQSRNPDIMGCLVCLRCDKAMKWRTSYKKRVLCEEEENSGRTPQTSSVSAWSHVNEASVWILSYSESLWR